APPAPPEQPARASPPTVANATPVSVLRVARLLTVPLLCGAWGLLCRMIRDKPNRWVLCGVGALPRWCQRHYGSAPTLSRGATAAIGALAGGVRSGPPTARSPRISG